MSQDAIDVLGIAVFDLHDVPMYDRDVEERGDPDAVTRLENALGWVSRPPSDPPAG